jgi:hypothetical protein
MTMLTDMYQEYLFVIGKLKDIYGLHVDVDHKDIHTFYKDKKPLFKLFYGMFTKESDPSIVISFHLDLIHAEAIQWFSFVYRLHPMLKIHDSYIEDSNGETYLGEDALAIRETYMTQDILGHWLENHDEKEMKEFVEAKVLGRQPDHKKTFDSRTQIDEAIIEFERVRKASDEDDIH